MHAFHSLAYLDVEKSGSTYVSRFLRDFLDDDEVAFRKHVELEDRPPAGRLHVISVRDPLDTYLSLYSYGCQGKGGLSGTIREAGLGHLYDGTAEGFDGWLDVVLDPAYASALNPRSYDKSGVAPHTGLLSYRVARLSSPRPRRWMRQATSADDFVARYRSNTVVDVVLRNESLTEDLEALVRRTDLEWRPSRAVALETLRAQRRLNTSRRLDDDGAFTVPHDARRRVAARERLLTEVFGYDDGHRSSTTEATHARSSA
ncbi:hypothetical protein GCM10009718_30980 [Isoptericola halotolerans]|uniref:Sulfotransferase family protein n=1 Tax=Isoptericola halotolerans TaxID=300560 RepID=A0ABX2A447_9MICO|nr:hypothetical protein [Isoptericola halotolerans]NOV97564.1 hypothetical protein [Isoptericola halotolerans]